MAELTLERYRAARETSVPAGKHTFRIRRPTELEVARVGGSIGIDFALRCVVGWDLQEIDLIPGGAPEPVAFSPELFVDWVADRPEDWRVIVDAVTSAYKQHKDQADERGNA